MNRKRSVGEIDILAKRGETYDVYEVKCSYRITKARKQTKKLNKHLGLNISNFYFYCGANSSLVLL
jgi:Holliday junction resolvase-like predicted endonuclease